VHTNITSERSSQPRDMVVESGVLLRIEHFQKRSRRSPRKSIDILSTSSRRKSGLCTAAFVMFCTILPAWSRYRCADDRGSRLIAHAAQGHAHELAIGRGARCSGPRKSCPRRAGPRAQDGARNLSTRCCTARYSTMRSFTFSSPSDPHQHFWRARCPSGSWCASSRHFHEPINVIAHHCPSADMGDIIFSLLSSPLAFFACLLRHAGAGDLLLKLGDLVATLVQSRRVSF